MEELQKLEELKKWEVIYGNFNRWKTEWAKSI